MDFQKLIDELKRRNVHRVATVYTVTGWLIIQVIDIINEPLSLPEKFDTVVIILVAAGLPIAVIITWLFELTPSGIKKTNEIEVSQGFNDQTNRNLNRMTIAGLALVLALLVFERVFLVGSGFYEEGNLSEINALNENSVVVLPFEDFSPQGDQEWFADGLTDELLNSLSRVPELRVIARTTSFALKGKNLPTQKIADSLKVNYLVVGSVRKAGNKIKVTAQLINPKLDKYIWSSTFEKEFEDIFDIQQDIAEGISATLNIYFDDEKREEMFSTGTQNADAYEAYLRGNELFNRAHTSSGADGNFIKFLDSANIFYEEGIRLDPNFAAVYYRHQDPYVHYIIHFPENRPENLSETQVIDIVRRDFSKAIKLAKSDGERLFYQLENASVSNDWSSIPAILAELESKEANLKVMSRLGLGWASSLFILLDREDIALRLLQYELLSDPLNRRTKNQVYAFLTSQGQLDSARSWRKKEIENGVDLFWELLHGEKIDEIFLLVESLPESNILRELADVIAGNTVPSEKLLERVAGAPPMIGTIFYSLIGQHQKADSIVSVVDREFLGSFKIADFLNSTEGKLTFSLSAAPHFSARLKEAGITDLAAYEEKHRIKLSR